MSKINIKFAHYETNRYFGESCKMLIRKKSTIGFCVSDFIIRLTRNLQNPLKQAELVAGMAPKKNNLSSVIRLKLLKSNFINHMSKLPGTFSQTWLNIQSSLFPLLSEEFGPLTGKQQELVATLEAVRIEEIIYSSRGFPGRPPQDHLTISRAFVAKTIYNMHFNLSLYP